MIISDYEYTFCFLIILPGPFPFFSSFLRRCWPRSRVGWFILLQKDLYTCMYIGKALKGDVWSNIHELHGLYTIIVRIYIYIYTYKLHFYTNTYIRLTTMYGYFFFFDMRWDGNLLILINALSSLLARASMRRVLILEWTNTYLYIKRPNKKEKKKRPEKSFLI